MFKKPFKLKFQLQLKSTERKKFGSDLKSLFPALSDEDVSSLISNKQTIVRMKVTTFKEEDVEIYCIDKIPMYVDVIDDNIKFPTVFMIWKFPHMLPTFTTTSTVLTKLKNGADLFFPGIYVKGLFFCNLDYKKNDPVCVNIIENKAAVVVGLCLLDKSDVMDVDKHKGLGKVVKVYHCVGDFLFKSHNEPFIVQLGPPDWALSSNEDSQPEDDSTVKSNTNDVNDLIEEVSSLQVNNTESQATEAEIQGEESNDPESQKDKENELLEYCFLKALKTTPKTSYPILPATFYANHVLTNLPEGKSLNIKKTKWKKFSTFLQEQSVEGLIQLQQTTKNEFKIARANTGHQRVREFADPYNVVSVAVESRGANKPVVQQVFSVTAATLPFFSKFGLKKHDELTRNDVRNHLNDYVKNENLVHQEKPELVVLDPILYQILRGEEVVSRSNLLTGILDKMSVQHKVSGSGNEIVLKGKMPLIELDTCVKTGNKRVTMISNLECYGVNVNNFSKELQLKAAASTTITPVVPGKKGPQLQVQGNQVAIAVEILKEKYNIHERFMKGTEKALKSKNRKMIVQI